MIRLTRLNSDSIMLNSDLIECAESTPDTVLTLTNGQKLRVRESLDEVRLRVIEYRQAIQSAAPVRPALVCQQEDETFNANR